LLILAATVSVAPSSAADKKEASFGKGGTGAYLTRDQLRSCLAQQDRVRQQNDDAVKEQAALTAMQDDIARSGDELRAKLDALDRTNPDAVTAFNDQTTARDKQIDGFQARVDAFNARVEANKTEREAFGKACDKRRYFDEDEIAIRKEKK
jgi:hypothetical protein